MNPTLQISPSGRLVIREGPETAGGSSTPQAVVKVLRTLASSPPEGLFLLAAQPDGSSWPSDLLFWHDFASLYLTRLCHVPESPGGEFATVEPPDEQQLSQILLAVPPMIGAEYLTVDRLRATWNEIDAWVREESAAHVNGLAGFLAQRAPLWRQVGRVCFHLAENKRDALFPFAFLATYVPGLSQSARARHQPLGKALEQYAGAKNKQALVNLLSPVHRAAENSPFVRELVDSGDVFHPLAWTPQEAYRFLQEAPLYEESGLIVRLPDWWRKRPRPQVSVTIGENRKKTLDASTMLDFSVSLALGDQAITEKEWRELLNGEDGLVSLKGQWVEVDRQKLSDALEHWKKVERASQDGELSFVEGMRLLAGAPADLVDPDGLSREETEWTSIGAGEWLAKTLAQLRSPTGQGQARPGETLRADLRHYQKTGVDWLWLLTRLGLGACLADDMGLGKTVQVLALLAAIKQQNSEGPAPKPSLLVLPASVLANWIAEIDRFTPSLSTLVVHPSETDKSTLAAVVKAPEKSVRGVDLVATTYGMLHRQDWFAEVPWQLVVLDEAQAIKNPATRQARAVKKLQAEARIALTGTPIENRLSDLWSLFDFLCPGLLGSAARFKKFVKALESRPHNRYAPLAQLVGPYILRRLKSDKAVVRDLPDKTEVRAYCGLSKRQAALYEKSVREMARAMQGLEGMKRRGLVLSYLMRFKQICNHPSQATGDGHFQAADSGKFARLAEICSEIASRQEKALVFTQFREMTEPISQHLAAVFGRSGLVLHGGTAVRQRKRLIDEFQREEGPPFFVLSLKAGGVGLNLTAASHVIHFDRWWNPAVENQATDRAYRIGQHRNVLVHKFVCRGTIEERIDELIEDKKSVAEELLNGGAERLLTEMSDQQLMDLIALDLNKAMA
jgi:non-specific serine/threonine protein kinase